MHYNLMSPDVAPVVLGFNFEAHNALAYKFNNFAKHISTIASMAKMSHFLTPFQ